MTIRHKGRTFLVYHRKRRKAMETEEILSSWSRITIHVLQLNKEKAETSILC